MTRRHLLALAASAQGAPYWEAQPPARWSEEQIESFFRDSPWARPADASRRMGLSVTPVNTFLSSARLMREAEAELLRRRVKDAAVLRAVRDARAEYLEYLDQHKGEVIALSAPLDPNALADAQEAKLFEQETTLKAGKRKHKMMGHFPPTPSDPLVRMLFPRDVDAKAKQLEFELYFPGTGSPYRTVYYKLVDMTVGGQLEL